MQDFDYIIVGAGAAGCVLANRLSADGSRRVLLLEAGGPDRHPFIHMPRGIAKVIGDARLTWPFTTEAEPGSNDASEHWARGRVLGGSTSINGMVYVRGQAADYDAVSELAGPEWSWSHMEPVFRQLENHQLGATDFRGGSGPLHISLPECRRPLDDAVIEAGRQLGLAPKKDVNEPDDCERIGYLPCTIHNGRRQSAAVAFLAPARQRDNLTIATHTAVSTVLFQNNRAVGVAAVQDGKPVEFRARREVLLCGGALASPALLQRSGIGARELLASQGIGLVSDLPEVGENLREHRGIVMQWRVRPGTSVNREFKGMRLVQNVARYYLQHKGPMTGAAYEVGAWVKTRPELERPDVQLLMAPLSFDYNAATLDVESHDGMNMAVYNLRPASVGSVRIQSRDAATLPRIVPNYLSNDSDRQAMIDAVRYARRLVAQSPLADLVLEETRPGPAYQSDAELAEAHRQFGYCNYHANGTCRMGNDAGSVVDAHLRVRGTEGLRVVDASVFPFMLSGNTMGPSLAVAWRAAELIVADE